MFAAKIRSKMGQGASSSGRQAVADEQREVESLAVSIGALPMLQNAFPKLVNPQTNAIPLLSLQQCFSLNYENLICEPPEVADSLKELLNHLGSSLADLFFVPAKGGLSWVDFVRGYVECCGRMPASMLLNKLLRLLSITFTRSGLPLKLEFESDDPDCKISGFLRPIDVLMIFRMCWTMWWDARTLKFSEGKTELCLPDVNHLVLAAVMSCAEVGSDLNVWDCNISDLDAQIPVGKFLTWTLSTVPNVTDCFTQFLHARLLNSVAYENASDTSTSSLGEISLTKAQDTYLLSRGRAWALSFAFRSSISEDNLKLCCPIDSDKTEENLLYRSTLHGRGLNRFWSNIEGYSGPLLILVSANSGDALESETSVKKWIIGALTQEGFENRDAFYGSSGSLYAISPIFHVFSPAGKEKNFVYCHLHPAPGVYERHPKPVGIAFGGTIGNERIFIDEDFDRVTVRHHAVDKTYQPGSLIPHQGYLPVESLISEVEVWGLGGRTAKQTQMLYKKREELFVEQRRRVDLKTFANWEDSPEKSMMDMISDVRPARREDPRPLMD